MRFENTPVKGQASTRDTRFYFTYIYIYSNMLAHWKGVQRPCIREGRLRCPTRGLYHAARPLLAASSMSTSGGIVEIEAEEAKRLLEREGHLLLDIRGVKDYDFQHITKPSRISYNWPLARVISGVSPPVGITKSSPLIIMCENGDVASDEACKALLDYSVKGKLKGGYEGWSKVWSPSGKKVVPGRWVSTGKEALKSGLTVPGAAESYTEGGDLRRSR